MKRLLATAATAMFLATSASGQYVIPFQSTEKPVVEATYDTLVLDLISWITANSDFRYNGEALPTIRTVSAEMMQILFYGEEDYNKYTELENTSLLTVEAIYFHEENTIYVYDNVDITDKNDAMHVLVHELIHYLQDLNNEFVDVTCFGSLEGIAYKLQSAWIIEHESTSKRPDGFVVLMATQCEGMN